MALDAMTSSPGAEGFFLYIFLAYLNKKQYLCTADV